MIKGQPYGTYMYDQILKEQLLISYLSEGAVTITETNEMPIHDRRVLLETLQQAEEAKKKRIKEIEEENRIKSQQTRGRSKSPKRRK